MRVYMDNCCFNRPFDDQAQPRIRLETEAKLEIQQRVHDKQLDLAWSYMLDFENDANPFDERRDSIRRWKNLSVVDVEASEDLLNRARELAARGVRAKDALHIACAITANCSFCLTTDDLLVRKTRDLDTIRVANPTEFVIEVER